MAIVTLSDTAPDMVGKCIEMLLESCGYKGRDVWPARVSPLAYSTFSKRHIQILDIDRDGIVMLIKPDLEDEATHEISLKRPAWLRIPLREIHQKMLDQLPRINDMLAKQSRNGHIEPVQEPELPVTLVLTAVPEPIETPRLRQIMQILPDHLPVARDILKDENDIALKFILLNIQKMEEGSPARDKPAFIEDFKRQCGWQEVSGNKVGRLLNELHKDELLLPTVRGVSITNYRLDEKGFKRIANCELETIVAPPAPTEEATQDIFKELDEIEQIASKVYNLDELIKQVVANRQLRRETMEQVAVYQAHAEQLDTEFNELVKKVPLQVLTALRALPN